MRGLVGPALASVAVMVIVAPAAAQLSEKWALCVNQGGAFSVDQRINGCSSLIQSGRETQRNLAVAYYSRGLAYYDKGDDDRAIAEYNEAIRLAPKFAQAYSSRGRPARERPDGVAPLATVGPVVYEERLAAAGIGADAEPRSLGIVVPPTSRCRRAG